MASAFHRALHRLLVRYEDTQLLREQADHISSGRLRVGPHTYGMFRLTVQRRSDPPEARVEIGAYCSLAREVLFIPGSNHRPDWVSTFPLRARFGLPGRFEDGHPASRGPIVVENDVWIARGARILSGVTIGNGAIVAASAVVAKDVRPYAIVAGNPAREIRRRFNDEEVAALERIAWWDWPEERVIKEVPGLNGGSVSEFISAHLPP